MAPEEQFIVDAKGMKTGVILPLRRYQRRMEDSHDLSSVAERRAEEPIGLEEMKRRLKKDGFQEWTPEFGQGLSEIFDAGVLQSLVFRISGSPSAPPITMTFALFDLAKISVASIPFHLRSC